MRQIDHDPKEPPRDRSGNGVWYFYFVFLAFFWAVFFVTSELHWNSFALGGVTGIFLVSWAVDITGNKVPPWMR